LGFIDGHNKTELNGKLMTRENKVKIGHFRVIKNAWQNGIFTLILTSGNLDL
jgi:hypothetical protein